MTNSLTRKIGIHVNIEYTEYQQTFSSHDFGRKPVESPEQTEQNNWKLQAILFPACCILSFKLTSNLIL